MADKNFKIAGETVFGDKEYPQSVVVEIMFDVDSNQVSFYTDVDRGDVDLHLNKEDLKRVLSEFEGK